MIRVYSAYRVSQELSSQAGVLTAVQQQYRGLVKQKREVVEPRVAFLADLEQEIRLWQQKPLHEVILMIDANESISEGKALAAFQQSLNMVDAVAMLNPTLEEDPTYLWGKKRIDYFFFQKE